MILPIGDTPNPRFTPWVNYGLIAANVCVFALLYPATSVAVGADDPRLLEYLQALAAERGLDAHQLRALASQVTAYDLVVFEHGWRPAAPEALDLLTSMFLHGGLAHLAGNMLFLWIYGDNVEHRLGRARYLLAYLVVGVIGGLGDGLLRPDSGIPTVGASGAISGVLGAYFVWFPHNRVKVFVFLFPFIVDVFLIPARWVLGAYLVLDNLLPLLLTGGAGGVSFGAHLGGFAGGVGVALAWSRLAGRPRPPRAAAGPEALLLRAQRLEERGDVVGAYQGYLAVIEGYPRTSASQEAAIHAADILRATGQQRAARALLDHVAKRSGVD